ncbi:MAG: thiolase family protein [Bacteroidota bacterium]|nr:thiolase family protein [Bacteroidota bacterium]MDP4232663.1 thiolase family protein [Bacteroidota bacterium]MDP4243204.1 thiolase family protein [Bacteroidota bacterium]MDP4288416.1 thiolase family protein [Bacteroidota bacterium]
MTPVILRGARTPIGTFMGSLAEVPAPRLGSVAIKAALERSGVKPEDVEEVYMGCVLTAGVGQAPARQASIGAGIPNSAPCTTINKVCGSGMKAVMMATQAILLNDASVVVAGGMESMSNAPYLLAKARSGYKMGNAELVDEMIKDGLWDVYNNFHMGEAAEMCADECAIPREAQDEFAIRSFKLANESMANGAFASEITPVTVQRGKETVEVTEDENPKKVKYDKVPTLKPAFRKDGTVTAANASSINDGGAALVVTSEEFAKTKGYKPTARILAYSSHAQEPAKFTTAPVYSIRTALKRAKLTLDDIDLFEVNEAFAVVSLAAKNTLGIPLEKLNVLGGAIALGHPIGASGTRIIITLLNALERQNKRIGLASICIGGGEATTMIVERL